MQVGMRIRQRRRKLGLSQQELAERVGTPQCQISLYESGRAFPRIDTVEKLAAALETTASELLRIDDGLGKMYP